MKGTPLPGEGGETKIGGNGNARWMGGRPGMAEPLGSGSAPKTLTANRKQTPCGAHVTQLGTRSSRQGGRGDGGPPRPLNAQLLGNRQPGLPARFRGSGTGL